VPLREPVQRLAAQISCDTCRLNSTLCVRCFAMAFILKAQPSGQLLKANLSTLKGPLQTAVRARTTFSSAPQVRARASLSGAGPV
jgi:hypothetical protein